MTELDQDKGMHPENVHLMCKNLEQANLLIKCGMRAHYPDDAGLQEAREIIYEVKTFMASWLNIPQENGNNDKE